MAERNEVEIEKDPSKIMKMQALWKVLIISRKNKNSESIFSETFHTYERREEKDKKKQKLQESVKGNH